MTPEELALSLRRAYESADDGDKTLSVHLWAIQFAEELDERGMAGVVVRLAGLRDLVPAINDAKKLARYVVPRAEVERLREIIMRMHKESEHWRRFNFDQAGHPSHLWQGKPPPI